MTGDVTLGDGVYGFPIVKLGVYSTDGIGLVENSDVGLGLYEFGTGVIALQTASTGGIDIDATGVSLGGTGTGPINFISAGGVSIEDDSVNSVQITESSSDGLIGLQGPISVFISDGETNEGAAIYRPTSESLILTKPPPASSPPRPS